MSTANVGKVVTWFTYPNAKVGEHTGRIVAFVPADAHIETIEVPRAYAFEAWSAVSGTRIASYDRYLVRGEVQGKRGPLSRWYAPRASVIGRVLVRAEQAATAAAMVERKEIGQ